MQKKDQGQGTLVSIVLPLYNEEKSLPFVLNELFEYLPGLANYRFEITFIDDCSKDGSFNLVKEYAQRTPANVRLSIARLARNSGSHVAITAGLNLVKGDFVIVMASDGQDPAEVIGQLLANWEQGHELVLASRHDNLDHSRLSKMFSGMAWKLMNWSTNINMPASGCDLLGMDKKVLAAFNKMDERNTTFIFRILSLGYKQKEITYIKRARHAGKSNWTLYKKISILVDAMTSFSSRPLKLITNLGLLIFFVLILRWIYVIFNIYVLGQTPSDLTIILNTIFTSLAVIVLLLGIIGDYIWRILDESRKRPVYEISEVAGRVFD